MSTSDPNLPIAPAKQFLGITPCFLVRDVVKAAEYYRDALGFSYSRFWGEPACFCMPGRNGLIVMLSQVTDASVIRPNSKAREETWDAYVWVKDADALYAEVTVCVCVQNSGTTVGPNTSMA